MMLRLLLLTCCLWIRGGAGQTTPETTLGSVTVSESSTAGTVVSSSTDAASTASYPGRVGSSQESSSPGSVSVVTESSSTSTRPTTIAGTTQGHVTTGNAQTTPPGGFTTTEAPAVTQGPAVRGTSGGRDPRGGTQAGGGSHGGGNQAGGGNQGGVFPGIHRGSQEADAERSKCTRSVARCEPLPPGGATCFGVKLPYTHTSRELVTDSSSYEEVQRNLLLWQGECGYMSG